ncbi:hypothetical protein EM20IM_04860 [Candidatus Methylacidiphilum infernorum]|uniref:Uncharacterized protein n=1 Tax=Candidatus Methylacidiphilum infernorum TaxID=511746 RepID=A0ABX7PXA9_9BACT|nr:hypothetical protein [Candidatus Methylacidiphilum infernorum]QSR87651.1 hypothetical protein EM20IM_04860 [Candidatus Methylacidiphilum infernorum]
MYNATECAGPGGIARRSAGSLAAAAGSGRFRLQPMPVGSGSSCYASGWRRSTRSRVSWWMTSRPVPKDKPGGLVVITAGDWQNLVLREAWDVGPGCDPDRLGDQTASGCPGFEEERQENRRILRGPLLGFLGAGVLAGRRVIQARQHMAFVCNDDSI